MGTGPIQPAHRRRRRWGAACAVALAGALALAAQVHGSKNERRAGMLPEFAYPYADQREHWVNSPPLSVRDLRGQVVVVEFWTFGCVNCRRSIPWVKSVEEKFAGRPFTVVGIHTPEFDYEKDRDAVAAAVARLGITHPVMLDNDFVFWRDMGTRYWPTFHIVNPRGRVVATVVGEVHSGTERAERIERLIAGLLGD